MLFDFAGSFILALLIEKLFSRPGPQSPADDLITKNQKLRAEVLELKLDNLQFKLDNMELKAKLTEISKQQN
ncbi:hypothetical protein PtA15_7A281 [Puccinia triticina]|uniref:Uncharacterized protein n=1 Tax=Puccinia triticina TaxID=208348 RepID=A0ABY7CS19_9BASI|nr:uncharacterized protein PtA15_7A281 [Puccinia triticina]WAQ86555.1 hypothetical protein PtA15_7A281 [Puccinia triticina]WAR56418.1 hypothetical protein PtB15_7B267 [Puccinia triticina]